MRRAGELKFITVDTKHHGLYRDIGFTAHYNSYPLLSANSFMFHRQ